MGTSRIRQVDLSTDNRLLIAMILHKEFLARLADLPKDLFDSKWANQIASWCRNYFKKYGDAPKENIQTLYDLWSKRVQDQNTIQLVGKVLTNLSDFSESGDKFNLEYLVDIAQKRFNEVKLREFVDNIERTVNSGEIEESIQNINSFKTISINQSSGKNLSQIADSMEELFNDVDSANNLIQFRGDMGAFFREQLGRECFVSFQGHEKVGKSWCLLELAYRALRQGNRVAVFEAGDLTEKQYMRRLAVRFSAQTPIVSQLGTFPVPEAIERESTENGTQIVVVKKNITRNSRLTWQEADKKIRTFMKNFAKGGENFMLSVHPNDTLTISAMKGLLDTWERERGFVPDVIVVDYADLLVAEVDSKEERHRINSIWKGLRRLSQEKHCLVLTATQSNRASYNAPTQGMENTSEDKRKLAHVTGMIGINQSKSEKEDGLMRLNWVVLREAEFYQQQCLYVAGCLRIGKPWMVSSW